ncbi:MAG: VWA domain-containing protein [Gammaproteobacteria bacterium]|nr:VWA domain-containing protein [Gammaproteobacteria bacterium]
MNLHEIVWYWPWMLLALPLPLLLWWLLPVKANETMAALRVPTLQPFSALGQSSAELTARPLLLALAGLCWLLLLLAAARPQWLGEAVELPVQGRDLMLAVDLSGSMAEEDFLDGAKRINRLQATKQVAGEFIEARLGDRIGLILFGSNAYLQTPLTFDRKTVRLLLEEAALGIAGDATAIGDAIGLGIKRIDVVKAQNSAAQPVLILVTDGANTAGEVKPLAAAELAAKHGIRIYTIGIGADEMLVRSLFGTHRINPSRDLDEKGLKAIAEITGGRYFRARDREELLQIYQQLDELEPISGDELSFRPIYELYHWPLAVALLVGLLLLWLRGQGSFLLQQGFPQRRGASR